MSATRYYYGNAIRTFLESSDDEIYGSISRNSPHDDNRKTKASWIEEIQALKNTLRPYADRGSIFFEYNIPRMGRRADVILVIDGIIFLLEFKTSDSKFSHQAVMQTWDYAIDLKNFQLKSLDRTLVPILVVPSERDKYCITTLEEGDDGVFRPLQVNLSLLSEVIEKVLLTATSYHGCDSDLQWARGGYEPTPTIIEAAIALYNGHNVDEITKHEGNIEATMTEIDRIITHCKTHKQKAVCFVTGVPGAGKTLIGLQTAIRQFNNDEKAIYLSGNYPLVRVLQEALARDFVERSKADPCGGKVTKTEARSKVKSFIQMIHHYRDLYLEGTEIKGNEIIPKEGYFESHRDKAYVPADHVAIFDEAQRAWTREELQRFMREKKGIPEFPYSEPAYLISCMDRQPDWGVVICLIGGGQEINKGEAGMPAWIEAINTRFPDWHVYFSNAINSPEYSERPRCRNSYHLSGANS
ncbi:MAG: DUF2075 domain-containing protein [Muribaculaceae bacterium]|nr:DUF2075 domain-containing protein [Muribaculaceae bacterium]